MKTVEKIRRITEASKEKTVMEQIDALILEAAQKGHYYCYYEHDDVKEHSRIKATLEELGWTVEEPQLFRVPQSSVFKRRSVIRWDLTADGETNDSDN